MGIRSKTFKGLQAICALIVSAGFDPTEIRREFDKIAVLAQQKSGLDQIREINLSVNTLLRTTHYYVKSPETQHWRSVDYILDSKYRDDCKDFVVLKEELLKRAGIKSERVLVMVKSTAVLSEGNKGDLHVVLRIHYGEREIILHNLRDVMVNMEDLRDAYELYGGAP